MANKKILQANNQRFKNNNSMLNSILETANNLPINVKVELQEKTIIPKREQQEIISDGGYTALSKVTIKGDNDLIAENIKSGVEIFGVTGTAEIRGEENAVVKIKIPNSTQSTGGGLLNCITHINTSLKASGTSCEYMFYYCAGLKYIKDIDTTNVTNMKSMFNYCNALETVPQMDTSKVTTMQAMFAGCTNLKSVPLFDTSNVTNMESMFSGCTSLVEIPAFNTSNVTTFYFFCGNCRTNLTTIPLLDTSKAISVRNMFTGCDALEHLGGFKNLGKAYTKTTTNNTSYTLDLSASTNLTHDSLINVINNLYDLNLSYNVANGGTLYKQSLVLGSTNKVKLQGTEEGQQALLEADRKGWNVS